MARRPFTRAARGHDALYTHLGGERSELVKVNVVHAGLLMTWSISGPTMYII